MGEAEIKNILEERGEAEVRCHFCGDSYTFNASELEDIISGL
jgi:molecular chaperone Hsp33